MWWYFNCLQDFVVKDYIKFEYTRFLGIKSWMFSFGNTLAS